MSFWCQHRVRDLCGAVYLRVLPHQVDQFARPAAGHGGQGHTVDVAGEGGRRCVEVRADVNPDDATGHPRVEPESEPMITEWSPAQENRRLPFPRGLPGRPGDHAVGLDMASRICRWMSNGNACPYGHGDVADVFYHRASEAPEVQGESGAAQDPRAALPTTRRRPIGPLRGPLICGPSPCAVFGNEAAI